MWNLSGIPMSVKLRESYLDYVDLAHNWGNHVESEYGADEIERAVFKIGANIREKLRKLEK